MFAIHAQPGLYSSRVGDLKESMRGDFIIWLGLGMLTVLLVAVMLIRFNPGARLRRRLRKTHSRIISKARQPTVKFSVKTPKEK